jgi:hypothetical protein
LRRRTAGRYLRERVLQLLVPFILGVLVLTPILAYYELSHRGWWNGGSIVAFVRSPEARRYFFAEFHPIVFGPLTFSALGYHLWFLGFLFVFATITVPLFIWLKTDAGKQRVALLARLAEWRGGLLLLTLLPILSRFVLQPFFPQYTGWSDFAFMLIFFVLGYVLMTDERFMLAIRRDGLLYLILALACKLLFLSAAAGVPVIEWMVSPGTVGFYVFWAVFGVNAWCWTMVMFNLGMRFLDFKSPVLAYSREASFPIFWMHYPVTFFVAFYVVQWQAPLWIKMGAMIAGSSVLTLGLYELLVRHINPVRALFGMRPKRRPQ